MPASLYRLAGKSHMLEHTQVQTAGEVVSAVEAVEEVVTTNVTNESDATVDTGSSGPTDSPPSWDPTWTKTRLLEFAVSIGLNVTATNTKVEIIQALESSSSS